MLEILHVPRLKNNLFSMKHFDKVRRKMHIKQGIYIFINKSKDITAECKLDYDLYKLGEMQNKERQVVVVPTITQISMAKLWHHTLRHTNIGKKN
jgi:hypothetical protein